MNPPRWALFDLNGTLLDPRPAGRLLPRSVPGEATMLEALHDAVTYGMVDTMSGARRPFLDYVRWALARRLLVAGVADDALVDRVVAAATRMPPFPDSAAAVDHLRDRGVKPGVLTNSAAAPASAALARAGLAVDAVISVEDAGAYKPDGRVYALAVSRLGCPPDEVMLVSSHWWDVAGAERAGLRTAWLATKEHVLMPGIPEPDLRADSLLDAARSIAP